jgi:amidase
LPGLPVDVEVKQAVAQTADLLASLGHDVEYIEFPIDEQFGHDFLRYWAMLSFLVRFGGKKTFDPDFDSSRLEPLTMELSGLLKDFAVKMPMTLRRLRQFPDTFATAFIDRDVIVTPVLSHAPPEIGYLGADISARTHLVRLLRYASFTALQNVSGTPAITLPLSQSSQGTPIGVQFASAFADEATLLALAFEIEEATVSTRSLDSPGWLPSPSGSGS